MSVGFEGEKGVDEDARMLLFLDSLDLMLKLKKKLFELRVTKRRGYQRRIGG